MGAGSLRRTGRHRQGVVVMWAGLVSLLALGACAPGATTVGATPPGAAAEALTQPLSVHWFRSSAEVRAVYLQTYRAAGERLTELARVRQAGTWAVILDADETVLDNSLYQKERAAQGLGFTAESWDAWVRRVEADALPGAAAFITMAKRMGGHVVLVTNRDAHICDPTRENLRRLGIDVDAVLCREAGLSDKNPRFRAVAEGTVPGLAPLEVLLWVGDNIQDFPSLSQDVRDRGAVAFAEFGRRYFMLPNPMYGSWERNAAR
jgi:5'-nucleotidase (lipoprotein e(P4) family)